MLHTHKAGWRSDGRLAHRFSDYKVLMNICGDNSFTKATMEANNQRKMLTQV